MWNRQASGKMAKIPATDLTRWSGTVRLPGLLLMPSIVRLLAGQMNFFTITDLRLQRPMVDTPEFSHYTGLNNIVTILDFCAIFRPSPKPRRLFKGHEFVDRSACHTSSASFFFDPHPVKNVPEPVTSVHPVHFEDLDGFQFERGSLRTIGGAMTCDRSNGTAKRVSTSGAPSAACATMELKTANPSAPSVSPAVDACEDRCGYREGFGATQRRDCEFLARNAWNGHACRAA